MQRLVLQAQEGRMQVMLRHRAALDPLAACAAARAASGAQVSATLQDVPAPPECEGVSHLQCLRLERAAAA